MASRDKPATPVGEPGPVVLRPGMPVRLLPHDWPFLYSVLTNGHLVINQRLPSPQAARKSRRRVDEGANDAPT
jgi:hypothetical protein